MFGIVRHTINVLTIFSVLLLIGAIALVVRSRRVPLDACVYGHFCYTPHEYASGYFNALELHVFNAPGRWTCSLFRRECVAGPGRSEAFPGERGTQLQVNPESADDLYALDRDGLGDPTAATFCGVRYAAVGVLGRRRELYVVSVPHLITLALFALLPLGRVAVGVATRSRRRRGFCVVAHRDGDAAS